MSDAETKARPSTPAFLTLTAAPSKLVAGEMSTILVTVTTAFNEKVADGAEVALRTNYGGVLVPEKPRTVGGVAAAFLLTSSVHVGTYEVVAEVSSGLPVAPPLLASVVIDVAPTAGAAPAMRAPTSTSIARGKRSAAQYVSVLLALLIVAGLVAVAIDSPETDRTTVDMLRVLVSWPVAVVFVTILLVARFKDEIGGYISRVTEVSLPGGIRTTAGPPAEAPSIDDGKKSIEALQETVRSASGIDAEKDALLDQVQQLADNYAKLQDEVYAWWARYLAIALTTNQKAILAWYSRNPTENVTEPKFEATWAPVIPSARERQLDREILQAYGLLHRYPEGWFWVSPAADMLGIWWNKIGWPGGAPPPVIEREHY